MNLDITITTPALLFPAVSLLFLSYTNRFLHLSSLVRNLHDDWLKLKDDSLQFQIENLRKRLVLIRWMQLLGAASLFLSVGSMVALLVSLKTVGVVSFLAALILMGASLSILVMEIWVSGGALQILLNSVSPEESSD